jgi:hypothetical protein
MIKNAQGIIPGDSPIHGVISLEQRYLQKGCGVILKGVLRDRDALKGAGNSARPNTLTSKKTRFVIQVSPRSFFI